MMARIYVAAHFLLSFAGYGSAGFLAVVLLMELFEAIK